MMPASKPTYNLMKNLISIIPCAESLKTWEANVSNKEQLNSQDSLTNSKRTNSSTSLLLD